MDTDMFKRLPQQAGHELWWDSRSGLELLPLPSALEQDQGGERPA
jgi:hypothetical protein